MTLELANDSQRKTMSIRSLDASLKGFGAPPTAAEVVVERLTTRKRFTRAGSVAGLGLLAAAIALPIPLVHFVLVPGSLLLGGILGALRLAQREIFHSAEGPCPFCATRQRLGLAGKTFRLPRRVNCTRCGRELDLEEGR
jgi:hypothetical protein